MTGLIERIKQQGADVKWRTLAIPAWGQPSTVDKDGKDVPGKPFIARVKTLNLEEQREWASRIGSGDATDRILLIMQRTYDEAGKKLLFDPADEQVFSLLRNEADPMIVGALVAEILRLADVEVMRKKLNSDPATSQSICSGGSLEHERRGRAAHVDR